MKNYYSVLEVNETASTDVIKACYKALIKKYHPDNNRINDEFYNKKLAEINEAFEILSDESKRKTYDELLKSNRQNANKSNTNYNYQSTENKSNDYGNKAHTYDYNYSDVKRSDAYKRQQSLYAFFALGVIAILFIVIFKQKKDPNVPYKNLDEVDTHFSDKKADTEKVDIKKSIEPNPLQKMNYSELSNYMREDTEKFFDDLYFGIKNEKGLTFKDILDDYGAEWDYSHYELEQSAYAKCTIPKTYTRDGYEYYGYLYIVYKIRLEGDYIVGINDLLNPKLYNISDKKFYLSPATSIAPYSPNTVELYDYNYYIRLSRGDKQAQYQTYLDLWMPENDIKEKVIISVGTQDIYSLDEYDLTSHAFEYTEDFFDQLMLSHVNKEGVSLKEYIEDVYGGFWYFTQWNYRGSSIMAYGVIPTTKGYYVFVYEIVGYSVSDSQAKVLGFDSLYWSHYIPPIIHKDDYNTWNYNAPRVYSAKEILWEKGVMDNPLLQADIIYDYSIYNKIIEGWLGKEEIGVDDNNATDTDYILPNSDSQFLTESDLYHLTDEEVRLARNEIYARHGREFKSIELQEYFNGKHWYYPLYDPDYFDEHCYDMFNEYEKDNLDFIKQYE